jgi:hypothetical protein
MVTTEQTVWTAELKYETKKSTNQTTDREIAIAVGSTVLLVVAALTTFGLIWVRMIYSDI